MTSSSASEVLVELLPGTSPDDLTQLGVRVIQQLPPGLAIVAAPVSDLGTLPAHPGVHAVFAGAVPPADLERLDPTARAFAAAWNARQDPKSRPGDGLSWDTPGFDAP